jgi:UDP-3-O-[3-hydroxymyristoyl] glucosamine N-acyltransferase
MAGIHPSAVIDDTARVDPTARIGAGTVIGPGVTIGAHTEISELVVVVAGAKIGSNCFIAPGAKIGQPGFGYQRQANGEMMHFPHIGSVVIGDHVEIGANTCIDRGTIDDTIIHQGVKIDNLCHIAHNVEIHRDAVVIANSMIGGSVRIGPRAWIAPSVNVINGVSIGADVTAGMGATVVKPVADGQTVAGSPSVELSEFIRQRRLLKAVLQAYEEEQKK